MPSSLVRWAALLLLAVPLSACGDSPVRTFDVPPWAEVAQEQIAEASKHGVPVAFENDLGMRFVLIPSGTFRMGSPEDEAGRRDSEVPHEVTISKPFYMQTAEVTNGQYRTKQPAHEGLVSSGSDLPVGWVSWEDAVAFAEWLSARDEVRSYDLPTEAQWERACRAGTTTAYSWGDAPEEAIQFANGLDATTKEGSRFFFREVPVPGDDGYRELAPVGSFRPNPWGLYDMHGNLEEWCRDWGGDAHPTESVTDPAGPATGWMRVQRGGSCIAGAADLRSAHRSRDFPCWCDNGGWLPFQGTWGFRLFARLPSDAGDRGTPSASSPVSPKPPARVPWPVLSEHQLREARRLGIPERFENDLGMRFVLIPAGEFVMDPWTSDWTHVTLTRPFYMQITEVTNEQYRFYQPSHGQRLGEERDPRDDPHPAARIPYEDATKFAAWASRRDERHWYRLPTEAQWRYACRAGSLAPEPWDDPEDSAGYGNGLDLKTVEVLGRKRPEGELPADDGYRHTAPVASFLPNAWGLHDMYGNLNEWCRHGRRPYDPPLAAIDPIGDREGSQSCARGGSWMTHMASWAVWTYERTDPLDRRGRDVGFRLMSPLPDSEDAPPSRNEILLGIIRERGDEACKFWVERARREGRPGEQGWPQLREKIRDCEKRIERARLSALEEEAGVWLSENLAPHVRTPVHDPAEPYPQARVATLLRTFVRKFQGTAAVDALAADTTAEPGRTYARILRENPLPESEVEALVEAATAEAERDLEYRRFGHALQVYDRLADSLALLTIPEVRDRVRLEVEKLSLEVQEEARQAMRNAARGGALARKEFRFLYHNCGLPDLQREIERRLAGFK